MGTEAALRTTRSHHSGDHTARPPTTVRQTVAWPPGRASHNRLPGGYKDRETPRWDSVTNAGGKHGMCCRVIVFKTLQTECNRNTNTLPQGLLGLEMIWGRGTFSSKVSTTSSPSWGSQSMAFLQQVVKGPTGPELRSSSSTSPGHAGAQQAQLTAC